MGVRSPPVDRPDTNMIIAGLLRDLAFVQDSTPRKWGYKQAANAVRALDTPIEDLVLPDGSLRRIRRIGPASTRVIFEVLRTGQSSTVEQAIARSDRAGDIDRRRAWRANFLSRARTRAVLEDMRLPGPRRSDYRGDLQMHSTWSDGSQTLADIVATGIERGYEYSAITDHSAGLPIARGLSLARFRQQWKEIDELNREYAGRFLILKGVEANIRADGEIDVNAEERQLFDVVVAAPHAALRSSEAQTGRMVAVVETRGVHILGHPRGRMYGSRPGVSADWPEVFAAAARTGVAIEIDGDPSRQDLDYVVARQALDAGCLFALDSDAHAVGEWSNAETAMAHAKLAAIPPDRIVNCWPLDRLLDWARGRAR